MRAEKKKKKKVLWIILSIIGVLVLSTGGYAFYLYKSAADTVASIHEDLDREKSDKRTEEVKFSEKDPISILLMGVDEREGDVGRSDSLILMTVNPNTNSTQMVSIPRDTRTEIVGKGKEDKINHAYAFGGTEMALDTVENFLDIPIDYFVKINMESFKDTVDAVGGVEVNNTLDFTYEGYEFNKGLVSLDGKKALAYTRMRYEDPRGDFGRQDRQRQVIEAVIKKGANVSSITKFGDMFGVVRDNVKTNLTFDEMWEIQANYKAASQNLEQFQVKGSGDKINGIYYYIVPEEERLALSKQLKEHLEISENTASTSE
ncbi:LytR family transcriptional regulator [Metabacillus sediminilitoris]|uniref:Polyisoprenyl-teichoic acid--peptidoglycan teichoic acid transferase TagU n=1 Tax=Metabacillus sediminilitoris TaxID=2567941 RepID=A0A4S4C1J3_9BACI|nr:LytR family transcriptional regulator [Metabacillus sediminilitoris]QGQ48184.1 LytR family transcriptional regulator [Metabacillus sediminilitoris]THF81455.1 LytR family transcriptional regulator [Metabacillus sediminilitoris]